MTINTSYIRSLLLPGIDAIFGDYSTYPEVWKEVFSYNKSERAYEYDVEMKLLGLGQLQPEGSSIAYQDMGQRFVTTYYHRFFGIGFVITAAAIRDNLYKDRFPLAARSLKNSLQQVKQIQAASVFNNGFNPAYVGGDQQPLYSTQHPIDSGVFANTFAVPAQLNETSLQDAVIGIQYFRDAAGLLVRAKPKKLYIPPALQFTADVLLNSKYRTGTGNNDISAIYNMNIVPGGYVVDHFLSNPKQWQLTTDIPNGLKYFERDPLEIDMFTDISTNNLNVRAVERYSFNWTDPRCVFGTVGA